ncbi:MAG: hypothetical protein LQ342_006244 [Letrouitia transgressa]|nr:MAG: hypothetical protein LQ342_006244 [Letrouitia transgressa]
MNNALQSQLSRVESALNTLITSIESYNPSVPAALDLLSADSELQNDVQVLCQHQANHARILALREKIEAQNQQITSTLQLLADARQELIETPATAFPEDQRKVPYHELLDYAKRISRYTVPPTFRERPVPAPAQTAVARKSEGDEDVKMTNGAVAPAAESNGETTTEGEGERDKGIGVSSLEQSEVQWLDPMAKFQFVPWPSEEVIKRGALAQIQVMLEQGVDPTDVEHKDEPIVKQEEREDVEMATEPLDSVTAEGGRKIDRREEKPKVFKGLDLDVDSDDDE